MTLLTLLLLPFLVSLGCLLGRRQTARPLAIVGSGLHLIVTVWALAQGEVAAITLEWIPSLGINLELGVSGAGYLMLILAPLLTTSALLLTPEDQPRMAPYCGLMLMLSASLCGLFMAQNLGLFYIFFELMLIPAVLLTARWGGENGQAAAFKFFLYTLVGSLPMLLGVLVVWNGARGGSLSFSDIVFLDEQTQIWAFGLFALAFAIKTPLVPLHGWLVFLYKSAPAPVTAVIAGAMSKAGVYGFIQVGMVVFPQGFRHWLDFLLLLAVVTLFYGAVSALGDKGVRGTLAFSSLSHMGMIALGIFSLNELGVAGAGLQMFSHGIATGGLFLVVALLARRGCPEAIEDSGGLAQSAPKLSALFLAFTLAGLGQPGLCSYPGELMIITGLAQPDVAPRLAALCALAIVLAAWYMLRLYQGVMQGEAKRTISDLRSDESFALAPLLVMVVAVGVFPGVFLEPIQTWLVGLEWSL